MTSSPENPTSSPGSLARDSVGTTLTNGTLFLLGIIIWVAVARLLGPVWRGELALVMLAPMIAIKAGTFGYEQGMVVIGGKDRDALGRLTRTGVALGFLLGLFFIALFLGFMWGFPKTFWRITQVWLPLPFLVISLSFPLHLVTLAYDSAIYAEDRIAARNAKELVVNLVMILVIFAAVFLFNLQLMGVIGAYVVANVVSLAYAWLLVRSRVQLDGPTDLHLAAGAVRLGFPIYLASLASYVMLPAMMILLSFALPDIPERNLARIAFFTMAYQMVDRILPVTRSVAFALLPKITAATDDQAGELAAKASRHTLLASLALFVVLVAFMHPIVAVLLGKRYLSVVSAFAIMAPAGVALSVGGVWSAHLLARFRAYYVARAGIVGVLVALVIAGLGFHYLQAGREVFVASTSVVVGTFVNAGILLAAFCGAANISPAAAIVPRMSDFRDWRRVPGFVTEMIRRSGMRF